jgi:PAS domain S-box-containing protein
MNRLLTANNKSNVNPLMHALFNSNPLPIALMDEHGIFTKTNDAFCKLFGYSSNSLFGETYERLFKSLQINETLFSPDT